MSSGASFSPTLLGSHTGKYSENQSLAVVLFCSLSFFVLLRHGFTLLPRGPSNPVLLLLSAEFRAYRLMVLLPSQDPAF